LTEASGCSADIEISRSVIARTRGQSVLEVFEEDRLFMFRRLESIVLVGIGWTCENSWRIGKIKTVLFEIQTPLRSTPREPHRVVYIQYAYASMAWRRPGGMMSWASLPAHDLPMASRKWLRKRSTYSWSGNSARALMKPRVSFPTRYRSRSLPSVAAS